MVSITLAIILIVVIIIMIVAEYHSHVSRCLFHFHKLDKAKMNQVGITLTKKEKDVMYNYYIYSYKNISFFISKRRWSLFTYPGAILVKKSGTVICSFKDLSPCFRTGLYKCYLKLRYPHTLGKWIHYQSKQKKVKMHLQKFMQEEELEKLDVSE